jgi:hypothetical protein
LLALSLAACRPGSSQTASGVRDPWQGRGRECVRAFLGENSPYSQSFAADVDDPVLDAVPAEARRTLSAAGIAPLVAAALREVQAPGHQASVTFLAVRQDLGMRLISLETQLAAVIFEAECTGELIEAMMFDLDRRAKARELRLAMASLVIGAVAATTAGVWDLAQGDSPGPSVLGLSGGVGSAALGVAAFIPRAERMTFMHTHNLLAPIVRGEDPRQMYPVFVFRLLSLPSPDGDASPRQHLLQQWQALIEEALPASARTKAAALLYGEGGVYDQELMALRERMYDALESKLNALARDLELLDRFVVRALEPADYGRLAPAAP